MPLARSTAASVPSVGSSVMVTKHPYHPIEATEVPDTPGSIIGTLVHPHRSPPGSAP